MTERDRTARTQGPVQAFFAAIGRRLHRYALAADGAMRLVDTLDMPWPVQYACHHAQRGLLYVACSNGGVGHAGHAHGLAVVDAGGTALRLVGDVLALPHRPIHAALDLAGCRLLVAYNRPAALTVHALDADGQATGPWVAVAGTDLMGWFPHQVLPMPGSDTLLLTCRGDDATASEPEHPGSLRVLRLQHDGPVVAQHVAPRHGIGFGPRNSGFHPTAPVLYTVLERQNRLSWFPVDQGRIGSEPAGSVDVLERPATIVRPQLGGALALHPSGRWAYVVNRSHAVVQHSGRTVCGGGENSVAVFGLDAATGAPQLLQHAALAGLHARCMVLTHGGSLLVAAIRQRSARRTDDGVVDCPAGFSVFSVADDGRLTLRQHHAVDVGEHQLFWAGCGPA